MADWKTLDTKATLERKRRLEATTSANVGGYVGPAFGPQVMRPPVPAPVRKRKKKDRP